MSHLMIHTAVAVFLASVTVPMTASADQQYRERVLVGDFHGSEGKNDRKVVRDMVNQKLVFVSSETDVDLDRWPYLERLRAELEDNLPTTRFALKTKWKDNKDVLAFMHGPAPNDEIFSSTIVIGEKVPDFQVEVGFADIPRKGTFRSTRDAMELLLYYALLKDARQKGLSEDEIIRPLLNEATEILMDVKKNINEKWVKDVADDLAKLRNSP